MKPDWLPDWRDAKAYPKPKDLDWEQWAWQFLRRNPEYQKDYESWRALLDSLPEDCKGYPSNREDMRFYVYDPPARDGESWEAYRDRLVDAGVHKWAWISLIEVYHKKYSFDVGSLIPPSQDRLVPEQLWGLAFDLSNNTFTEGRFYGKPENNQYSKHTVQIGRPAEFELYYKFNLEWPISTQLERAKLALEDVKDRYKDNPRFKPIERRNRVAKFPFYLRLLDANTCGADYKTIAKSLMPRQDTTYENSHVYQTIRNGLRSAEKLRDHDYRYLVLAQV